MTYRRIARLLVHRLADWLLPGEWIWRPESVVPLFGETPSAAAAMAARVLIDRAIREGADRMTLTLQDVTHGGSEEGDWRVVVERVSGDEERDR